MQLSFVLLTRNLVQAVARQKTKTYKSTQVRKARKKKAPKNCPTTPPPSKNHGPLLGTYFKSLDNDRTNSLHNSTCYVRVVWVWVSKTEPRRSEMRLRTELVSHSKIGTSRSCHLLRTHFLPNISRHLLAYPIGQFQGKARSSCSLSKALNTI